MKKAELKKIIDKHTTCASDFDAIWNAVKETLADSHPSPMSAEQVEELADKYASEEFDKHSFSEFKGAENSLWENRKADFIAGYNAATTPSVKADGWVSVEEKKRLEQIIELKEKERQEWANMCISKQKRIDELENPLKAAPPNVNN